MLTSYLLLMRHLPSWNKVLGYMNNCLLPFHNLKFKIYIMCDDLSINKYIELNWNVIQTVIHDPLKRLRWNLHILACLSVCFPVQLGALNLWDLQRYLSSGKWIAVHWLDIKFRIYFYFSRLLVRVNVEKNRVMIS